MTATNEQPVDVIREDRFCHVCGENLRSAPVECEPHYGMHLARCPRCGTPEQVELRPLARTGQRWAGLILAFWFLGMLWLWTVTTMALVGMSLGIIEESSDPMTSFIEQAYENKNPEDAGGIYQTTVQTVAVPIPAPGQATGQAAGQSPGQSPGQSITIPLPPMPPTSAGGSNQTTTVIQIPNPGVSTGAGQTPGTRVIPLGPGRQLVIQNQDDDLRSRFEKWWALQDQKALRSQAGGFGGAIPWNDLRPWMLMGFIPLGFGIVWSIVLLNISRRRLVLAWPVVCLWYGLGMIIMLIVMPQIPVQSPRDASMLLIMPMMLPVLVAYFTGALLIGLLIGRSIARVFVRVALSPRACSSLARLWLADGNPPPRFGSA